MLLIHPSLHNVVESIPLIPLFTHYKVSCHLNSEKLQGQYLSLLYKYCVTDFIVTVNWIRNLDIDVFIRILMISVFFVRKRVCAQQTNLNGISVSWCKSKTNDQ